MRCRRRWASPRSGCAVSASLSTSTRVRNSRLPRSARSCLVKFTAAVYAISTEVHDEFERGQRLILGWEDILQRGF